MNRRYFITTLVCAALSAGPVLADSYADRIISQLTEQGFTKIVVKKTFLGRIRFIATGPIYQREIVINRNTGEVLRDYTIIIASGEPAGVGQLPQTTGQESQGGTEGDGTGDDDDDDDDPQDDPDSDDEGGEDQDDPEDDEDDDQVEEDDEEDEEDQEDDSEEDDEDDEEDDEEDEEEDDEAEG